MDTQKPASASNSFVTSRELYRSPRILKDPVNAFSIEIPEGWIAGMDLDGLYGLEPIVSRNEYIFVTSRKCSRPQIMRSLVSQIDLTHIQLVPTSEVVVSNNLASAYYKLQGSHNTRKVFVVSTQISDTQNVLFAAISYSTISIQLKYTTLALANSAHCAGQKSEVNVLT